MLHSLQRAAGNVAVTRLVTLVQRQPDDDQDHDRDVAAPGVDDRTRATQGGELVEVAATVLPPGGDRSGADALVAIQQAGLTLAALRLLVSRGHTDRVALSNLAFWAAHPDQFGRRLQPDQPGFRQLLPTGCTSGTPPSPKH